MLLRRAVVGQSVHAYNTDVRQRVKLGSRTMAQVSHRDQLLEGAIKCLRSKGYTRTTARDIARAANANLASIGYHFGSKEALLNEAITRACEEWTTRLGQVAFASGSESPLEQMGASWIAMLSSFQELRPVLVGLVEAVGQS